jgi:EAL domain-containing protein (putative c-di-GMP-specific phosphodiesterase class I)
LDDFGTGFSSLSYLKDLPIDTLKIDKSFIDGIATDSSTTIITRSVITMVKQLGVETVAEGVENKEQFEYLKQMNCDNIQGYLLGKPMSEEEIEKLIM